jgi:hypothetical protein
VVIEGWFPIFGWKENRLMHTSYFKLGNRYFKVAEKCNVETFKHSTLHKSEIYTRFMVPGVMRGHNRVKYFYICFNGEILWKSLQETTEPKKGKIFLQGDLIIRLRWAMWPLGLLIKELIRKWYVHVWGVTIYRNIGILQYRTKLYHIAI